GVCVGEFWRKIRHYILDTTYLYDGYEKILSIFVFVNKNQMKFPNDFMKQMRLLLGKEHYEEFMTSLQVQPPSVSIRLNDFWKPDDLLFQAGTPQFVRKVPWCSSGYYMKQRLTFTFDPLLHAGCYYVQEASSMFLEQVIKQYVQQSVVMLDLCAAPGGKSTHTQSLLPEGSLLVANEIVRNRSQ
ncbi:Ribosomal RNA small subunit methyltransferase F, partial [termite gut metagenome]